MNEVALDIYIKKTHKTNIVNMHVVGWQLLQVFMWWQKLAKFLLDFCWINFILYQFASIFTHVKE